MRDHDMTPEEHAEHEEISKIVDFDEWSYAINRFWDRYYAEEGENEAT